MEILSENPKSFKMDRKSPQASILKTSVSEKLFEFLGNYSDDVLAEYIVVLVCNGKHQYQARDDLEAFLGDQSGEFVAWLWNHLSKAVDISKTPCLSALKEDTTTSGFDDDLDRKLKVSRLKHLQKQMTGISDIELPNKEKQSILPTFLPRPISPNPDNTLEDQQHWCASFDSSLTKVNDKEVHIQTNRSKIPQNRSDTCNEAMKHGSSKVGCSGGISAGGEQCLHYEDQYEKMVNSNYNGLPHLLLHSPKKESVLKTLESVIAENPHSKLLPMTNAAGMGISSKSMEVAPHPNIRPRGNVWDRLGKPCDDDDAKLDEKVYLHDLDFVKRRKPDNDRENLDRERLMLVMPDGRLKRKLVGEIAVLDGNVSKCTSNMHNDECTRVKHSVNTMHRLNDAGISKHRRRLGEIDPVDGLFSLSEDGNRHLQSKEAFQGLQKSHHVKNSRSEGLNGVIADTESSEGVFSGAAHHSLKSPNTVGNTSSHKNSLSQINREALLATSQTPSVKSSFLAKSEHLSHAGSEDTNHKPMEAEMMNMKLKLQQMEMEVTKLRSKQTEMNNDTKANTPLGAQSHSEEDVESRTVFVTNVHFAATKEALSSHFSKCGAIVKTTLLIDTVTTQPKGSAYVVFASKASADKAVSMSGTSFFSRILKVMRKADVPAGVLSPSQPAGKPSQPWRPSPPFRRGVLQKPNSTSHLQWRRDPPTCSNNSASTQACRPEVPKTA